MTRPPPLTRDMLVGLLGWMVIAAILATGYLATPGSTPQFAEGDDAMRMVMVQGLLDGQPWQNQNVPRDNTPYGGEMHWSALVGVPLAAMVALLGERLALIVWPLLLLLPLVLLSVLAVRRLVPAAGAGTVVVLILLNIALTAEFSPARIDHHNVQVVLVGAALVTLLLRRESAWGGALAGVVLATCLAVGVETLPIVMGAGVGYALCWLIAPLPHRSGVVGFAAGLTTGLGAHLLIATPMPLLATAYCDVNSVVYLTAGALASGVLAASALAVSAVAFWPRLMTLVALGAAALVATVLLYPQCLAGPYAGVDARMLTDILPLIPEVRSFWQRLLEAPALAIPFGASVLAALAVTIWQVWRLRGSAQLDWLVLLCMLAAAALVMLMQLRGARLAAALAIPAAAWAIAAARDRYRAGGGLGAAAMLLASWLIFATWAQAVLLALPSLAAPPRTSTTLPLQACLHEYAYRSLAALPAGRVAAPIVLGPYILLYTPHAILSAGYHRNGVSARDSLDFFTDESRALEIVRERSLNLVAACASDPELIAVLDGRDWLQALEPRSDALRVYAIDTARIQ